MTTPSVHPTPLTFDADIAGLLFGGFWSNNGNAGSPLSLSYSFASINSYYLSDYDGDGNSSSTETDEEPNYFNLSPITTQLKTTVKYALDLIENYTNITFNEVSDSISTEGTLRFGGTNLSYSSAWAYLPNYRSIGGDVWFSANEDWNTIKAGTYYHQTILHEIGHALGLKHPHEEDIDGGSIKDPTRDSLAYTTMSYRDYIGGSTTGFANPEWCPYTYMVDDIKALQFLYGKNDSYQTGNNTYSWTNKVVFETIWDAGGTDTINWTGKNAVCKIDLTAGALSFFGGVSQYSNPLYWTSDQGILGIAYDCIIENASGGNSNDILMGNSSNNVLTGNAGNDTIYGRGGNDHMNGGLGNDTMLGGSGNDIYYVNSSGDRVFETTSTTSTTNAGGTDLVYSSISLSIGNIRYVENLTLTGSANLSATGNALNNTLTGNSGNNVLNGSAGNDRLNGGLGNDTMLGGSGNDIYYVNSSGDRIFETTSTTSTTNAGGTDLVYSSISLSIGSIRYVENLTLTGSANLSATGNALNNTLTGNSGNNALNGGAGNDTLIGGAGADQFVFNTLLGSGNFDTIKDFLSGTDKIVLDDDIFAAFSGRSVTALDLILSTSISQTDHNSALSSNGYLTYSAYNDTFYYDADGVGGGDIAVAKIELIGVNTPAYSDFSIIA